MDRMIDLAERGWVPDPLIRRGIRRLLQERLRAEGAWSAEDRRRRRQDLLERMRTGPIALAVEEANQAHYEVPADFFRRILGRWLKYSSCYWEPGDLLDDAEERMLRMTAERAGVEDGMEVLDLGCGWGSLSLWLAQAYPACRILAVSNSSSQRQFIEGRCRELGLENLAVVTADMNHFQTDRSFHRVLSVEMFEHMRNQARLLQRIAGWLLDGGRLFVHIFCHRELLYFFETDGQNDWMARHFFTGGMMPSEDLMQSLNEHLQVEEQWRVDGTHYQRTLLAWLDRMDSQRQEIRALFRQVYGDQAGRWFYRWRIFLLASAELFGYRGGQEWYVSHYRMAPSA